MRILFCKRVKFTYRSGKTLAWWDTTNDVVEEFKSGNTPSLMLYWYVLEAHKFKSFKDELPKWIDLIEPIVKPYVYCSPFVNVNV